MTTIKAPACPKRVYRMRPSQHGVGIIFVTVGSLLWVAIWTQIIRGTREARVLDMMAPVVFTAICLFFTTRAYRADVRTSETAIELQTFMHHRILPIDLIRGRRTYLDRGDESPDVRHLVLVSGDDRFPSLDIADLYNFDEPFRAWFHSLPDLDDADRSCAKTSSFGLAYPDVTLVTALRANIDRHQHQAAQAPTGNSD